MSVYQQIRSSEEKWYHLYIFIYECVCIESSVLA